jgi:PfaB family protein
MDDRIAIIGMEAILGADEGLDAFDRTVFDGIQHASLLSANRNEKVRWGTKSRCKEGYAQLLHESSPPSAESLLRTAIDGALGNTLPNIAKNQWNDMALIVVSEDDLSIFQSGPKVFSREDSALLALQRAQALLSKEEVHAVVIGSVHLQKHKKSTTGAEQEGAPPVALDNGLCIGDGAVAMALKQLDRAKKDEDRIYAIMDAIVVDSNASPSVLNRKVGQTCKKAHDAAGVAPRDISYIEVMGASLDEEDTAGIRGLAQAYPGIKGELTCVLGSLQPNIEHTSPTADLASLVKVALCLYHRYVPGTPGWTNPKDATLWDKSPFYVPTESRPWFADESNPKRIAAVSSARMQEIAHVIFSEDASQEIRPTGYLALVAPYCFPLAGENQTDLAHQLHALEKAIETNQSIRRSAEDNLAAFQRRTGGTYALMVVGYTREELVEEIQFMQKGIPSAFETGSEIKTPKGTYFTANPLGRSGKVAFVYPGVGSAYVGLGQAIFHLFPKIYEQLSQMTTNMGELLKEKELYPRSRERLTFDQMWKMELGMRKDIMTISRSGMAFFALYTMILRDIFKVTPDCALGYSMGEPGMLASLGVWPDPLQLSDRFSDYPTFRERIHGRLDAVRQYWGLAANSNDEKIWDSYTLQASAATVEEAIGEEERVFMTIINTPGEVVIAGDPEACLRVIKKLDCKYYALSLNLAIHCDPVRLEYDRLVDLYTLPVNTSTGIKFYSSSCYKPIPIRSKAVGHSTAKAFCETVDFPRLVNQAYEDGARLFIEMGSRKFCCNLIEKILEGRDYLAVPMNVKGTKDQTNVVRVLAQLVSHRVPVELSPVF